MWLDLQRHILEEFAEAQWLGRSQALGVGAGLVHVAVHTDAQRLHFQELQSASPYPEPVELRPRRKKPTSFSCRHCARHVVVVARSGGTPSYCSDRCWFAHDLYLRNLASDASPLRSEHSRAAEQRSKKRALWLAEQQGRLPAVADVG